MSRSQRTKGRRGEREALALLAEHGIEGELRYGQEERGGSLGDIETTIGNVEVKRRSKVPAWLSLADAVRLVLVRQDRGPWLAVMRASDVLHLLRTPMVCSDQDPTDQPWTLEASLAVDRELADE